MKKNKAIFPGTFETFHKGHISVLKKALKIFDFIYIVVSNNENKKSSNLSTRYKNLIKTIDALKIKNVEIIMNDGLTVDIINKLNIYYIIRGVRSGFDLEYEMNLFYSYKKMNKKTEIIIFVSNISNTKISSSKILKRIKNE